MSMNRGGFPSSSGTTVSDTPRNDQGQSQNIQPSMKPSRAPPGLGIPFLEDPYKTQTDPKRKPPQALTPPQPQLRRLSSSAPLLGDSFTVHVGPADSPTIFAMHQTLVSEQSQFFAKTFSKSWKENVERVVRLPDCQPAHFQLFFLWLYKRCIFSGSDALRGAIDPEWSLLAHAWLLGDYLQATDFKDAITDTLIAKVSDTFLGAWQTMHEIIYPRSTHNAPIRRLIADIAACKWENHHIKTLRVDPEWAEFLPDLSAALAERRGKEFGEDVPWESDRCRYHEHAQAGTPCYSSKC